MTTAYSERTGGKLAGKMAKAMAEIGRVPKRGRNQAQNYSYARADDVAEHARAALSGLGVAVYASVKDEGLREIDTKNGKARISRVLVTWTFVDSESGEERSVTVPGEGMDHGDKGIYKAMTGSLKYALMLGFLIPTGDADPEREDEPAPRRQGQRDRLGQKAAAAARQAEAGAKPTAVDVWTDRVARARDHAELDNVKAEIKAAMEADPEAWTEGEREALRDALKRRWHAIDETRSAA